MDGDLYLVAYVHGPAGPGPRPLTGVGVFEVRMDALPTSMADVVKLGASVCVQLREQGKIGAVGVVKVLSWTRLGPVVG